MTGKTLSVSLTVSDLARSLTWYTEVLGFSVSRRHEREGQLMAVSLQAGDVRVLLTQDDGEKGAERVKGAGFSMMITTDDDIDTLAKRAVDAGVTLDTEPSDTPWGARMFRVRDPDGFRFTISSPVP